MQVVAELKFEKIRQIGIGQGLNSVVYLAHDPQLNAEFAVKQIDKAAFWNPDCFAEAKTVQSVAHPNVVSVQYGCEKDNLAFIAMPFYKDGSLADRLVSAPMALSEFMRLAQGVLQGLAHIHARGYLHLDLKPSNILIGANSRPLIADFGQARSVGPGGLVKAPPLYRKTFPPEVLTTELAVVQSDIYQMGVLLYRALNGDQLFNSQLSQFMTTLDLRNAILKGKFPSRKGFLPHVPKRLRTLIRKALALDPLERFNSSNDFADALGRVSIQTDWSVQTTAAGETTWLGTCVSTAPLVVRLLKLKTGWSAEVYTNRGGLRARGRGQLWKLCATRDEGLAHLNDVFARL
jgi:serine/threonine protein kinase